MFGGRTTSRLIGLVAGLALWAAPAAAWDKFVFRAPGAGKELAEALSGASLLMQARRSETEDADEILAAARADYARLLSALYAKGRFGAEISIRIDGREAAAIQPLEAPDSISVVEIVVRSGPLFRFGAAEIGPLAPATQLPETFRPGAVASVPAIEDAVVVAVDAWRDAARAKARVVDQAITADHTRQRLDARIGIDPGPKVTFGELTIEGQDRTREDRIREIAGFPKGQDFSPEHLHRVAERLRATGTFRSVSLTEAETVSPDGSMDVTLSLAESRPRRLSLGIEYTTTEALTLSAGWLHRNLFRGAERFQIDGEIAGIGGETGGLDYSLGARLTRPGTLNADTDLFVLGELTQKNEPDYTSKSVATGVGLRRELRKRVSGEAAVLLSYSSVTDASGDTIYQHVQLPLSLAWERRDDPLDPTDGFYLGGEARPFIGFSGSESGTRFTLDARGYEDFGKERPMVVAARVQVGSIVGASITGLPNDQRFYSGGGGTVRGQDYQSLDIDLGGGLRSGGRSFLGLSGEVRMGVTDAISVVGFADWGHISADSLPGSGGKSHAGAGVGLRYATGFGPLRFDVGFPVTDRAGSSPFSLYIGIGQAF